MQLTVEAVTGRRRMWLWQPSHTAPWEHYSPSTCSPSSCGPPPRKWQTLYLVKWTYTLRKRAEPAKMQRCATLRYKTANFPKWPRTSTIPDLEVWRKSTSASFQHSAGRIGYLALIPSLSGRGNTPGYTNSEGIGKRLPTRTCGSFEQRERSYNTKTLSTRPLPCWWSART